MTVKKILKLAELFEKTVISLAQEQQQQPQQPQRPPPQFIHDQPGATQPNTPIGKLYNTTGKAVKKITDTLGVDMSPEAMENRHEQYKKIDPMEKLYEATRNVAKQVGEKFKLDMRPQAVEKRNQEFLKWLQTTKNYTNNSLVPEARQYAPMGDKLLSAYEEWLRQNNSKK